MLHNDEYFYKKLEFDFVLNSLEKFAVLPDTKDFFKKIQPINNIDDIRKELDNVDEAFNIIVRYGKLPLYLSSYYLEVLKLAKKGGTLTALEIYETFKLFSSIRGCQGLRETLRKEKNLAPYYFNMVDKLYVVSYVESLIKNSIDDSGLVLDTASPALRSIRNKLKGIDQRIKDKLKDILNKNTNKLTDSNVVIRDDRFCLSVKAEYKNTFPGIVHDVSSSNSTAFIEPYETCELANQKERLKHDEKEEIERILIDLSQLISRNSEILEADFKVLLELDKIFAKASFAITYEGAKPHVNDEGILELVNAKHPLLKVKKVIPNTIKFGKEYKGIIITGPNTGGKTVLLKTVGLLSLMVKYGLLIPASEESNVCIYDHVFCDIGDDQSIEENLSTFSSHMKKLVTIVNDVTPNSLVLIDEIGSGTDPKEGACLAIGVIDYFIKNNVSFITTTHYFELKSYALEKEKIVNASMEFDKNSMKPTYHLIIGKSGSSNAFSIAKDLGLNEDILDRAKDYLQNTESDTSKLLKKLEYKTNYYDELLKKVKEEKEQVLLEKQELEKRLSKIDKERARIIKKAEQTAQEKLEDITKQGNEILDGIKQMQSDVKLHEIINAKKQLESIVAVPEEHHVKKNNHEIKVGDEAYSLEYDQYCRVLKIRGSKALVLMGNLEINLPLKELEYSKDNPNKDIPAESTYQSFSSGKQISLTLDLRGERYEDARDKLDKYFDDLLLTGIKSATIIHGFGTGALREMVQTFCKTHKEIDSYRYGGAGEGGLGVTVITIK